MISAVCWVPRGASKYIPEVAEEPQQPFTKEELEEILKSGIPQRSGNIEDEDADDNMDADDSGKVDEVGKALAAAQALGKSQGGKKGSGGSQDISDAFQELNMDRYDDEEDGVEIFGSGVGDAYYPSNELDPYLDGNDDDDEEEIEDMTIKPTDAVLVCAHNEDEINQLQVVIFEESEDGESNLYVHHEILLPAFPLCIEWLDCNLKGCTDDKGNFIAVGSMEPAIEIWDLDVINEAEPFKVLGGAEKKKKKGHKSSLKYKRDSHKDAVLGLSWNKMIRNVLASASADKTVKIWNMANGQCDRTLQHHTDKVQAVAWNEYSPELLLSGSFDHSIIMMDMRANAPVASLWSVAADVESVAWDPHSEHAFVVSLENGTVQSFDTRAVSSDSSSSCRPSFTLHAHDKAVCSVSYNPSATNFLATGSSDKMVKLWDISNNQPSCIASKNLKAGAVFSVAFYDKSSPFLLAVGGSKGILQVWDTMDEPGVAKKFGKSRESIPKPVQDK